MKRFFSVVGAFIIATGMSCAMFIGVSYADTLEDLDESENSEVEPSESGNAPELTFVGEEYYEQASDVDFYQLIQAVDEEDGEMTLSAENTKCKLEATDEAVTEEGYQSYTLTCTVTDSDDNESAELTHALFIKAEPAEGGETDPTPGEGDESEGDGDGDENGNEGGDGDNSGDNPDDGDNEGDGGNQGGEGEGPGDSGDDNGGDDQGDGDQGGDQGGDDNPGDGGDEGGNGNEGGNNQPGDSGDNGDGDNSGDDQGSGDNSGDDNDTPGSGDGDNSGDNSGDSGNNGDNSGNDTPGNNDDNNNSDDNQGDNQDNQNGDDNQNSDNNQGDNGNQDTPITPGSTTPDQPNTPSNGNSNGDLPIMLPTTGGNSIFSRIPRPLLYSLFFGFVVASIVYYRTDRATVSRKSTH